MNRRQLIGTLAAGTVAGPVLCFADPSDEAVAWVCPMHPSYTAMAAGTCPICGMTLIQTRPYDTRDYRLELRTEPAAVKPGEAVTLLFRFLHPETGAVVHTIFMTAHSACTGGTLPNLRPDPVIRRATCARSGGKRPQAETHPRERSPPEPWPPSLPAAPFLRSVSHSGRRPSRQASPGP